MGNFYTNITLPAAGGAAAAEHLRALGREAFVADLGGACVVFDRECEAQDTGALSALAEALAARLVGLSFAVLNHDDDILWFQLHDRSMLVAEYSNRGGPPTDVRALCRALGRPEAAPAVWFLLRLPFLFQLSRHRRLARRLGLPEASVGSGFDYISRGESLAGVEAGRLIRVGPGGSSA